MRTGTCAPFFFGGGGGGVEFRVAVVYAAIEHAVGLTVERILAHEGSLSLHLDTSKVLSRFPAIYWSASYGRWRALVRQHTGGAPAAGPESTPGSSLGTAVTCGLRTVPLAALQARSDPRSAFFVSFHNPLHWMLGALLLAAVSDRPDTYAGSVRAP